jgi:hypothetical protein
MGDLQAIFDSFCAFGAGKAGASEMATAKFTKFCKDTGLIDKKFTNTDVDLIFTKSKAAGQQKIGFDAFVNKALPQIAEKKGISVEELVNRICQQSGPANSGTKADAVKFHDDKSLYTGVYQHGGPSTVDKDKQSLASIVSDHNALTCDVRGSVAR